jgi:AI-2 transport protein TqsA
MDRHPAVASRDDRIMTTSPPLAPRPGCHHIQGAHTTHSGSASAHPGTLGNGLMADSSSTHISGALKIVVGTAALMIIIAGLRAAQPMLVPVALAAFFAVTSMPLLKWLRGMGVPSFLAVPMVLLLIVGLLTAIGYIATTSILEIREAVPAYVARFNMLSADGMAWLADHRIIIPGGLDELLFSPGRLMNLVTGLLVGLASFMSMAFLVALITLFLLAEASGMPRKLRALPGQADSDLHRYSRIMAEVQRYLAIKTLTSLATGVLIGLWALFIGLDFPLFWGLTAFLLNYVPTIGSLVAAIPAVLLALVQLGPGGAALTASGYLVVNTVIGSLVEPQVMGRGLGLSPFVVLMSLLFWGWVWGPIGMLLSLPLTMVLKILLEHSRELAWVAVLLGPSLDERTRPREVMEPAPPLWHRLRRRQL